MCQYVQRLFRLGLALLRAINLGFCLAVLAVPTKQVLHRSSAPFFAAGILLVLAGDEMLLVEHTRQRVTWRKQNTGSRSAICTCPCLAVLLLIS